MNKLFFFTILICFLYGCGNNDDSSESSQVQSYALKKYSPSFSNGNGEIIYAMDDIIWTFDFQNQTILVEIFNGIEPVMLNPGNYSYMLGEYICGISSSELIINNTNYGDLIISNTPGVLIIHDLCSSDRRLLFNEIE